jgi:hypothetical protein
MTDLEKAARQALEALEVVTKELLAVRDEIAERGARPKTNAFHQRLWDSSFKAYTDHALPAATAIKEALMSVPDGAQPEQETQGYREAAQLAKWLFKTHYAQQEHYASGRVIWGLCDTTSGVISQIDNMVCKLVLPKEPEQEPVAYMSHNKKNFVSADDVGNSVPNWTDYYPTPLYTTPSTCPTCEALARTVMMDQAGRDA